MQMSSRRPYLIRSLYEWINDNQCTACILVDATRHHIVMPEGLVDEDGTVVFNISPASIANLTIALGMMSFNTCFSGVPYDISVPIDAIIAIYALENNEGMVLDGIPGAQNNTQTQPTSDPDNPPPKGTKKNKGPTLKIVK